MGNEIKDVTCGCPTADEKLLSTATDPLQTKYNALQSGYDCAFNCVFTHVDRKKFDAITKQDGSFITKFASFVGLFNDTLTSSPALKNLIDGYRQKISEVNAKIENATQPRSREGSGRIGNRL